MWGNKGLSRVGLPAFILAVAGVLFLGCQGAQQAPTSMEDVSASPGILYPDMAVEMGSYGQPHDKLGEKPAQPWSATTVAAAVAWRSMMADHVVLDLLGWRNFADADLDLVHGSLSVRVKF